MKELEDTKAAAEQKVAHLQTQLDEAATLGQSQAAELAAAQSSTASLQAELQGLQTKLAQSEEDIAASKQAQTAGDASATEKQQQLAAQASSGLALTLAPVVCLSVTVTQKPMDCATHYHCIAIWSTSQSWALLPAERLSG